MDKNGLIIVKRILPYQSSPVETVVVPREYSKSLVNSLHQKWDHPNVTQMEKLFQKQFFMLSEKEILKEVFDSCQYPCQALKKIPSEVLEYSTTTKPTQSGSVVNADVLKESKQNVLVVRQFNELYRLYICER